MVEAMLNRETTEELVRRAREGDREAFEALSIRFAPDLRRARRSGNPWVSSKRAGANAQQDAITVLECDIDGVVLQDLFSYRVESPEGGFLLNDSPLLADFGYPPGDRYPAVADGHWLLIPPLPAGDHVIHFHSEGSFGFVLDVTYAITVGR
jgi:hypothetical protein